MRRLNQTIEVNVWMGGTSCDRPDNYQRKRCKLCCTYPPVDSINKLSGVTCPRVYEDGCQLHGLSSQPWECKPNYCYRLVSLLNDPASRPYAETLLRGLIHTGLQKRELTQQEARATLDYWGVGG